MLHEFIAAHRELIIERARTRVRHRKVENSTDTKLEHGVPLFLTQVAQALVSAASLESLHLVGAADAHQSITDSATLHGSDLLRSGFTVAQVVHGYGDVCQVVTELAIELGAPIAAVEFRVFNRCIDDAIAGAVTAYGRERERELAYRGTERLGVFAHEVRNFLNTAVLSFDAIKKGLVGLNGSTGDVHARSLSGLSALVERSLAEVRLAAGVSAFERVHIGDFLEEIELTARMHAEAYGLALTVSAVDTDVAVDADRQLLASALSNLLQNAFKYTKRGGTVSLTTVQTTSRVRFEVSDQCGGLPPGKAEQLFRPFTRGSSDRSGLGLGLTIALSATRANSGELHVRDVPGTGCVFTIDLPRAPPPVTSLFQVLPHAKHGASEGPSRGPGGAHAREPRSGVA